MQTHRHDATPISPSSQAEQIFPFDKISNNLELFYNVGRSLNILFCKIKYLTTIQLLLTLVVLTFYLIYFFLFNFINLFLVFFYIHIFLHI